MCCCCCPPAINALFCLWVRSGCSKASVAGALTFFPPEPPFYKFQRISKTGELLPDDDDEDENGSCSTSASELAKQQQLEEILDEDDERYDSRHHSNHKRNSTNNNNNDNDSGQAPKSSRMDRGGLDHSHSNDGFETKKMTTGIKPTPQKQKSGSRNNNNSNKQEEQKKKTKKQQSYEDYEEDPTSSTDPSTALTERAARLRHLAKIKNARDARDAKNGVTYELEVDPRLQSAHMPRFHGSVEAVKIGPQPKTNNYIAAVLYRLSPDRINKNTKTIIYSHGNATDIGAMNLMQCLLAKGLRANVLMYDYSGYGASGGVPLEANTYRDIKLVYQWVVDNVVADESKIVVYGQSVGSGPSCYICKKRPNVGGLILHSPFMSGMRVLTPSRALACLDIFPNIDRIKKVNCRVMVIHGALDEEVDIAHGYALHKAVPAHLRGEPWWVPDRGHNDITDGNGKLTEYLRKIKAFMDTLDKK